MNAGPYRSAWASDEKGNIDDPDEMSNIDDPDEKKNIGDREEEEEYKHEKF